MTFFPYADAERTPVWLMRQAGRYMKAFREYALTDSRFALSQKFAIHDACLQILRQV